MLSNNYQNKYFAWLLDHHHSSTDEDKFTSILTEAKVDLNPHQIDAALFAFHSPLNLGAILADEVGLGKTIEAALVISQQWAEHKRHILIITPATLRKQWSMELEEKFYLPSSILEAKNFNAILSDEYRNPFDTKEQIIICSYQFAKKQISHINRVDWDLIVIDEAHKLRNVYKSSNKTATVLKNGLSRYKKLLLTATPLQNNIKELYGLISIIDENFFGSFKSFSDQYSKTELRSDEAFNDLKRRIQPIIHRTLRSQVQEYVKYTERRPFVQEYYPTSDEMALEEMVTEYLQREDCFGMPKSQRQLITLVLHKLLSSSTFAIAGTLQTIINRLQRIVDSTISSHEDDSSVLNSIGDDVDSLDDYEDEWADEDDNQDEDDNNHIYSDKDIQEIKAEINDLTIIHSLALGIADNSKGECLIKALNVAFEDKRKHGQAEKALIFTESNRTLQYIKQLLEQNGYAGKIVLFNGSNSDPTSKSIYAEWKNRYQGTSRITGSLTADKRQALVDYFKDHAQIMIATEAAAEGINLQFCSLVVNYDMPWNPQRVEQRIGRCHRYGQKNDVVVVNFINKANRADERVYELLDQKYNLFKGVFGSSDEVLGSTMDGIDFEHRVLDIYQSCRTIEEIDKAFDQLQEELQGEIQETLEKSQNSLIENFDIDVVKKLRIRKEIASERLTEFQNLLWNLTIGIMKDYITRVDNDIFAFRLKSIPLFIKDNVAIGTYSMDKDTDDAFTYRIGHPLAQQIIAYSKQLDTPKNRALLFDYTSSTTKIAVIEKQIGKSGCLAVRILHYVSPKEQEDHMINVAIDEKGNLLEDDFTDKVMSLSASVYSNDKEIPYKTKLIPLLEEKQSILTDDISKRNKQFIDDEVTKIERWAEDQTFSYEQELKNIKRLLKEKNRQIRNVSGEDLEKLKKEIDVLTKQQRVKRNDIFRLEDEIDDRRKELIEKVEDSLKQSVTTEDLFTIRWTIK